jgi:hypothetical protein
MKNLKVKQHTSKPLSKSAFWSPLQREIFLHLASNDPKTIHETAKAINGHYKSCWNAFKKLENKKLIKPVSSKSHHGREFPRYWVTAEGAFIALCEGAKARKIIRRTLEFYPDRRDLQYLLEAVTILGKDAFDIAYWSFISKGKFEQSDLAIIMATQMQHKLSSDGVEQFSELLQRFPEQQQGFVDFFKEISDNVKNLDALFKQPKSKEKK